MFTSKYQEIQVVTFDIQLATFWIFGNFITTVWHSSGQLSSIFRAQSEKTHPSPTHSPLPTPHIPHPTPRSLLPRSPYERDGFSCYKQNQLQDGEIFLLLFFLFLRAVTSQLMLLFGGFLSVLFNFFFRQIYPGFYHKLLNEPKEDATLVMNDIISWINQRLPS